MRTVKCVLVGDENVDKRELFIKYVTTMNDGVEAATVEVEAGRDTHRTTLHGELNDAFENGHIIHHQNEGAITMKIEDFPPHPNFRVIQNESEKGSVSSIDSQQDQDSIEQWSGTVTVAGKHFFLEVRDARCNDAYDNIRPEVYPDTDVFLVCFSVVRALSWENALNKWIPEIQEYCPITPFILVGTHTEWRELWDEKDLSKKPVYAVTGTGFAQQVGAAKYLECSTCDNEVKQIFDAAVLVSIMDRMELSTFCPEFERDGSTLLHRAAKLDHLTSLEALVDTIDLTVRDKELHTALDIGLQENNLKAVRFLLESGCEMPAPPDPWKKVCEFWVDDNDDSERVVNSDITDFTRQLTFFYTSASPRPLARILLIGQNGTDVAKFVNETVPMLPVRSLTIVNADGPALFDLSRVQSCLEAVTITNCDLGSSELPGTIYTVGSLKSLCVVKSGVSRLSEQLGELKSLQRLRLSANKIRKLPHTISRLQKLKFLHCDRNALDNLPDTLGCLGCLETLDLSHNKLEKLAPSLGLLNKLQNLWFTRNRLKFPPTHILNRGTESILEFLSDFLDDPVANSQIKMAVVGGSDVGKTAVVKALNHTKDWRISGVGDVAKTKGVEISSINLMLLKLKLKVFDLAGDEAFFSSHHFFLSENTLYQVVFDMSAYTVSKTSLLINQLGRLELWLQVIYSRAPNSHVLLVGTHADDPKLNDEIRARIRGDIEILLSKYRREHKRQFEGEAVPQCGLCEGTLLCEGSGGSMFYVQEQEIPRLSTVVPEPCIPHVIGYYEVSCQGQFPKNFLSSRSGSVQKLKVGVGSSAHVLLNTKVSSRIPQKCLYVRDRIHEMCNAESELKKWPLLTYDRLREIASGCGVKHDFKIKALMTYFHSQGEILWYEDMPGVGDVIFIDPSWVSKQVCLLVGSSSGASSGLDGILRIDNLAKTWPDVPEGQRFNMLTLFRNLGLCVPLSETEDLVPFQLPIGRPDKDTWPEQPAVDDRQISCEFHFNFLPPTFFSDLTVAVNRRNLPNSFDLEPTYYRFHMVFATTSMARMGCSLHCKETTTHPLAENLEVHRVSIEAVPFENKLKVLIRGSIPCCVLPDVRAAIKMVVDTRYPGIRYIRRIVCPTCERTGFKNPSLLNNISKEGNNFCSWGHALGTEAVIMAGDPPVIEVAPELPAKAKGQVRLGVFYDEARGVLEDCYCPRLLAVFPVGFQSAPFGNRLRVNSPIRDGFAVHFLCECPGYWHLTEGPGFRIPNIRDFLNVFGARACKLLKLAFMLREDGTRDGADMSRVPVKIVFGDKQKFRDSLIVDIQDLLEHYFLLFPDLKESCTSFMQQDLDYLQSYEALSRSKLCKLLEISPDWWRVGPLVCTYNNRTKEHLWLCEKHAV